MSSVSTRSLANAIRILSADGVERAASGHPGLPLGMADVVTVLFRDYLKQDAAAPRWLNRDRFVLSAGHGSMLLYSVAHLLGHEDVPLEVLKNFRSLQSPTAGHPEYGLLRCVETTTGPLAQGFANGVGMAIAERWMAHHWGENLIDHHCYVVVGDGCLMEGLSHEAASLAGHLNLRRLIVLFDDNGISIDGSVRLASSDDHRARFESYGWQVLDGDGHDEVAIKAMLDEAHRSERPSLLACRTHIGYGAPHKQGSETAHGAPLGSDEVAALREQLEWHHKEAFFIPDDIKRAWRAIGAQHHDARLAWEKKLSNHPKADQFKQMMEHPLGDDWRTVIHRFKKQPMKAIATRKSSQQLVSQLTKTLPNLIGGSADLTQSNGVKGDAQAVITRELRNGQFIHYGIREMGMAAVMNGLALYGGIRPYGGSFLVFTDYARPAMRLSALMRLGVIYVMTHDSIGVGEDGPTHQPIEHLASLRAIPNMLVLRPMDGVEMAECWEIALQNDTRPSVLVLTRQDVPVIRDKATPDNLAAKGAYVVRDNDTAQLTLLATGSEVAIAIAAHEELMKQSIASRVVSMPCWELFEECHDDAQKAALLGKNHKRIAIEAAASQGWDRYLHGLQSGGGAFIGMNRFGASATAMQLFDHFDITAKHAVAVARKLVDRVV